MGEIWGSRQKITLTARWGPQGSNPARLIANAMLSACDIKLSPEVPDHPEIFCVSVICKGKKHQTKEIHKLGGKRGVTKF